MPSESVTALIVHYNTEGYTHALIGMLRAHCSASLAQIVVVDNGSTTPFAYTDASPGTGAPITIFRHESNRGYAAACNAGVAAHASPYYFILNSDIEFSTNPLGPLLDVMARDSSVGVAGPALFFPDGRFQLSWGDAPSLLNEFRERRRQKQMQSGTGAAYEARKCESAQPRSVDWLTGAAMLIRKEAFDAVGGFDEEYFFYFEDVDFCARLRRSGWRIAYEPRATLIHFGGGSQAGFNPQIARAYRLGHLRYYARFCGRISFCLLKIYLSSVFGFRLLTDSRNREATSRLLRLIRKYPYSTVA